LINSDMMFYYSAFGLQRYEKVYKNEEAQMELKSQKV